VDKSAIDIAAINTLTVVQSLADHLTVENIIVWLLCYEGVKVVCESLLRLKSK
jgi:hypothetical protein